MKEKVEAMNLAMQSWELETEDAVKMVNELWAKLDIAAKALKVITKDYTYWGEFNPVIYKKAEAALANIKE